MTMQIGRTDRDAFADWIRSENFSLTDLEKIGDPGVAKALISPQSAWWKGILDNSDEPIPGTMLPLEQAALLFAGWSAAEDGVGVVRMARSRLGKTFAAGRSISAAAEVLERHARIPRPPIKGSKEFAFSRREQSCFVEFDVARKILRRAPLSEHFLSEPIERLFRQHAWMKDAKPTYAQLAAANVALEKELATIKATHKAATVKRANRMLEALKALDKFATANWSMTRNELLDLYEDGIVNNPSRKAEWSVPTRDELERWIKDRASTPRRPAQNRKAEKSASAAKSADSV
jgi:hypothetical protein